MMEADTFRPEKALEIRKIRADHQQRNVGAVI
jgi:hypothetical protein